MESVKLEIDHSKLEFLPVIRKLKIHHDSVHDILCIEYPTDQKKRLLSTGLAGKIVIYSLEMEKVEDIIDYGTRLYCLKYENEILFSSDYRGFIVLFKFDWKKNGFELHKTIKFMDGYIYRFVLLRKFRVVSKETDGGKVSYCTNYLQSTEGDPKVKKVYQHKGRIESNLHQLKSEAEKDSVIVGCSNPSIVVKVNFEDESWTRFPEKHEKSIRTVDSFICQKTHREKIISFCLSDPYNCCFWKSDGTFLQMFERTGGWIRSTLSVSNELVLLGNCNGDILTMNLITYEIKKVIEDHSDWIRDFCLVELEGKDKTFKFGFCSDDYGIGVYKITGIRYIHVYEDEKERIEYIMEEMEKTVTIKLSYDSKEFQFYKSLLA